jgi:hypothetical protein
VHNDAVQIVSLENVYDVPQQNMNLLSVHTLHEHNSGANFDTTPGYIRFSTATGDSFINTIWHHNLPYIPVSNAPLNRHSIYTLQRHETCGSCQPTSSDAA